MTHLMIVVVQTPQAPAIWKAPKVIDSGSIVETSVEHSVVPLTELNQIADCACIAHKLGLVYAVISDGVNNKMFTREGRSACFSVVNPVRAVDTRTQV